MWTEGDEGGVGDASLNAGDTCGGVEESSEELSGAASSESPEAGRKKHPSNHVTNPPKKKTCLVDVKVVVEN